MLSCTHLVGCPSTSTSMSKYVALPEKRKHNPWVWRWRGLITFLALRIRCKRGGCESSPPRRAGGGGGGGRQKAQRLSSYICPLHPFLLSSTIGSGIMTLTGTLRRKVVITQIWWKSREHTAIHAMVNNALRCGGEKKKKKQDQPPVV